MALFWLCLCVAVTTFATADVRGKSALRAQLQILPEKSAQIDRHGQDISKEVYIMKKGTPAWHGTKSAKLDVKSEEFKDEPLWLGEYSSNALAGAMKADGSGATISLYLYAPSEDLSLLNLRFQDSKKNQEILNTKAPVTPEDEYDTVKEWPISMGNPSNHVLNPIKKTSKLCEKYNGWRSPWDQDEFMICANKKKETLKLLCKFECEKAKVAEYLESKNKDPKEEDIALKEVTESGTKVVVNQGTRGLRTGKVVKNTVFKFDPLKTYDLDLIKRVNIRELVDAKKCAKAKDQQGATLPVEMMPWDKGALTKGAIIDTKDD